jgi:hypothetical protein
MGRATAPDRALWIVAHTLPPIDHGAGLLQVRLVPTCPQSPRRDRQPQSPELRRIVDQNLLEKTVAGNSFGERVDRTMPPVESGTFSRLPLFILRSHLERLPASLDFPADRPGQPALSRP